MTVTATDEHDAGLTPGAPDGWSRLERAGGSIVDVEDPAPRAGRRLEVALWAGFVAVALVVTVTHEMWRDELQAWSIAREATWPWDVVANTRYEGHPPTWHLVLWVFSNFTRDPWMAHAVSLACMCGAAWLVLRFMPVTLPVRVLLLGGYYPLYEMGAFARSYGLVFLLAASVLALAFRPGTDDRPLRLGWIVVLLVMLATTAVQAVPLAGGLALAVGLRHWRRIPLVHLAIGGAAVLAGGTASVLMSRPPRGGRNVNVPGLASDEVRRVLVAPLRVVWPLFHHTPMFWNRFVTRDLGTDERWVGLAVLVLVAALVWRTRPALAVWLGGALGFLALTQAASLPMEARQLTILWVVTFATAWAAACGFHERRAERPGAPPPTTVIRRTVVRAGVLVVLIGSVWGAAWPVATDLRHPFSASGAAASWIRDHTDEPHAVFCVTSPPLCSSVAIQLDWPAYIRADGEPFTYVEWRARRTRTAVPSDEVPGQVEQLLERLDRPVVIVGHYQTAPPGCHDGWMSPPTIEYTERFVVCFPEDLTEWAGGPVSDAGG